MSSAGAVSPAFRIGTAVVAVAAAGAIAFVRFFGPVPMPTRPPPPQPGAVDAKSTLTAATGSAASWRSFLEQDARAAGVPVPRPEEMGKPLVFREDTTTRVLAPGDPPVQVAGLELTVKAVKDDDGPGQLLVLGIRNLVDHDLGYQVVASPQPGGAACNSRTILVHDAMVVRRQASIERSECTYSPGMKLQIDRVETVEVDGLMSVYLSRVPPTAVGADPMLAKAHRPHLTGGMVPCNLALSQVLRTAIENGSVRWRDLIDFYARHRCDSYQFPMSYKAFEKQDERPLPATGD
ncbi:MAG TPA: hypothetical protein VHE35_06755 [Kofleriaceae bacterium]|nr:hypothetical protein [Kofleriaceae bacterium]